MAEKPSFQVIGAVQDLNDLYNRINPRGPYRMSLFSEAAAVGEEWPQPFHAKGGRIDVLIRGVSCLLANDLAESAWPVAAELWNSIVQLEGELAPAGWRAPDYYQFLARELSRPVAKGGKIYQLFGEVLAVYLDIICAVRGDYRREYGERIRSLRRLVVQTGESSSSATFSTG